MGKIRNRQRDNNRNTANRSYRQEIGEKQQYLMKNLEKTTETNNTFTNLSKAVTEQHATQLNEFTETLNRSEERRVGKEC